MHVRQIIWTVLTATSVALAAPFEKGTIELSGMGGYSVHEDNVAGPNTITTTTNFRPMLQYYFGGWASVGLMADYSRVQSEVQDRDDLDNLWVSTNLGLTFTCLVPYSNQLMRPIPYLGGGLGMAMANMKNGELDASENGHFFTAFLGAKMKLSESFALNVQPTLDWFYLTNSEPAQYGIRIGFSGLL
jgi:Outer membrane protein beta-barrel domain